MKDNFKKYILVVLVVLCGCEKTDLELTMERGQYFYSHGENNKAINAFKTIIKKLDGTPSVEEETMLAKAYENLAIAYAKNGWYNEAQEQATKAFNLIHPQIDSLFYIKSLIKEKIQ